MQHGDPQPAAARLAVAAWAAAGFVLLLHLISNTRYGMFRDEFYYLACANHLAWGYVDHPPFSIAALAAWRALVGDGVWALRIVPAILHALTTLGAGELARRLGGNRTAQGLAALLTALAPTLLGIMGFTSMNAWEVAFWMAAVLIVAALLAGGDRRLWLLLGLVAGLGVLNKYSLGLALVGLALGILLSPLRRDLRTRWPWLGAAMASVLFLPHVLWQILNGWPPAG
jgi:4-amino-4-deoxy-L-arabinose transferase-like glycosyltransferase